jgi:predicted DNA-binding transcriptional regulator AlpA
VKRDVLPLPVAPADRGALLTPEAVAAQLGVSPRWVLRHVQPRVKLGQRTVRFYAGDVAAWLVAHRTAEAGA